ncbi:phosphoheptose isomerase [Emticicia agri]|uniref:Phosphoheptose isomerase n=1 Tax=Emticicia agri TaxID=2492393 RepID=A0A4Q5LVK6_9BACT|nr:phosphoheptose isomerase [Emticicia agri]RYU93712.1 phosphoheptose isomerase [Emticicia agri]
MLNLKETDKAEVFSQVRLFIQNKGFIIVNEDASRPWGGFLVIDETQASQFIETFFPQFSVNDFAGFGKLSPKILLVAPQSRLSWQYHFRRSEIWTVIGGNAAIVRSDTDAQTPQESLPLGSTVNLKQGERHRLIGVDEWGIIAEIWQHTDAHNPSDEEDIVRVQDDFGR